MPRYPHIYVATGLIALVIAAVTLLALTERAQEGTASETVQTDESVPPYTPEIEAALKESEGFEFLVSYTDSGFAPSTLALEAGQTVRFTNNSSSELWVTAGGESIYPGTGAECGQSAFDTCRVLRQGDFWEFTVGERGTWGYKNALMASRTGVLEVR
ncbi:MAG TPA: hypothetical protein VJL39_01225 [Candidatus Paceibacterota bacterium]